MAYLCYKRNHIIKQIYISFIWSQRSGVYQVLFECLLHSAKLLHCLPKRLKIQHSLTLEQLNSLHAISFFAFIIKCNFIPLQILWFDFSVGEMRRKFPALTPAFFLSIALDMVFAGVDVFFRSILFELWMQGDYIRE